MTLNVGNGIARMLVTLWALAVSVSAGTISNSESSVAIQATATVTYPVGVINSDDNSPNYLLYHPVDAGVIVDIKRTSGASVIYSAREPISSIPGLRLIRPDTLTIIYTEN